MSSKDTFNIKKSFGSRIKYYRNLKGLTQSQLAQAIGRTEETVSHIERGLNSTQLEVIQNIATVLSVEMSDLFDFNSHGHQTMDKEKFALIKEVIEM